jgi:hypothetical protein
VPLKEDTLYTSGDPSCRIIFERKQATVVAAKFATSMGDEQRLNRAEK